MPFNINNTILDGENIQAVGISGIVTDGLALHLDAGFRHSYPGGGNTWYDISGNGRHFTWVSTPSFTFDSKLSYFSTLDNRCTGPASNSFGIDNTSGYTIFILCLQNTLTQNAAFKFYRNGTGSNTRGISAHLLWTDGVLYFDQAGCCNSDTRTSVNGGGSSTWNLWTLTRLTNSSTRIISKNGTTLATNTATSANLDLNSTAVDLGSSNEFGGNTSTWNARLGGFLVYNRGLTATEILQNYNATKGRFGL